MTGKISTSLAVSDAQLLRDPSREGQVYRALRSAARDGARAPSDSDLAQLIEVSTHTARRVLERLALQGVIEVETTGNSRLFVLRAIRRRTAVNGPHQPALGVQSENAIRRARALERLAAREAAPTPPPARDPCFKCGTRADIGCAHQGVTL